MTRLTPWLILLFVFGLFGGVVYHALRVRTLAGKGMPPYSVYSADRDGLAEAARLLRRLGWQPVAVTRPIQELRPATPGPHLLVLVMPQSSGGFAGEVGDLSEFDVRGLLRWVEAGNTLLLVGRHNTALHRELGVTVLGDSQAVEDPAPHEVAPGEAGDYTDDIQRLVVEGADSLEAPRGLPLWWADDRPGAVLVGHGKGRVLVLADPSVLTRRGLNRSRLDNALFLVRVAELHAPDGRVYFDEYHHGLRSGGGLWGYLQLHDARWLLLPLLATLVIAGWARAVRLGPVRPQMQPTGADAVDYASALARIYERAGARSRLARSMAREFVLALARHLRLRRTAPPAELLAVWKQRQPAEAPRVEELLRGVAELRQGDVSERRLLGWARAFDQFRKSISV